MWEIEMQVGIKTTETYVDMKYHQQEQGVHTTHNQELLSTLYQGEQYGAEIYTWLADHLFSCFEEDCLCEFPMGLVFFSV
jgi:hypothetical protein